MHAGPVIDLVARVNIAAVALLLASHAAGAAPAKHQPDPVFDISDDAMQTPLGVVVDVAVHDGVVYLLDQQACNIGRITFAGETLPPIGRRGEGPGDLSWPEHMAVTPAGRCLILQSFSNRATCITVTGSACDAVDVSATRAGYETAFSLRADAGGGCFLIATMTSLRVPKDASATLEEMGASASLKRIRIADGKAETLFSTDAATATPPTVTIPLARYAFVLHGWDINDAGIIVYADPAGGYRMMIGHPADGESREVDLPELEGDDKRVRERAKALKVADAGSMPRVASIQWLDDEFVLVRPAAELDPKPAVNSAGTFEVFDRAGSSLGRHDVRCDFDPDNDQMFIRGDVLIVIRGAQAVTRSVFRDFLTPEQVEKGKRAAEVEEIRVQAYRLFRSLRATAR